ncbi:MAG: TerB family tellurite resistance protein [Flavobacteriales bacterium]
MNFSKEEKLRILSELIKVAGADGEHRDEEYDFLHAIAEYLQVEPMDMESLFTKSSEHPIPASEMQRIVIFHQLVLMVIADGEISNDEIAMLKEATLMLGLPNQAVNEVISRLHYYLDAGVDVEDFIKVFQVHHN